MMMTVREWWKKYYRAVRVARREAHKASLDLMTYGSGTVFIPSDGSDVKHIPIKDVVSL